jgi:hypothetical protein
VTRRFPRLRFAFLEGGVGWACQLYADLIEHWERRSREGLAAVDPSNLDRALFLDLARRYGGDAVASALRDPEAALDVAMTPGGSQETGGIENLDDFAACAIRGVEDFRELFVRSFYFGCEADDRMNAWAFDRRSNPLGVQLRALFGSDIGHFDVPDMEDVLPEAYELVERGAITSESFRDFVFTNPARFFAAQNPDFFRGTAVEREVAALPREPG